MSAAGDISSTLGGVGAGAAVGGPIGALIGGGIGLIGGLLGDSSANDQANAAQSIAEAQLGYAKQTQQQALGFAAPTADELQTLQSQLDNMTRTYTLQQAAYERDVSLVNAIDPTIISAGKSLNDLINGKEAPTLAPLRTQIATQRQELQTNLAQQYGPGFASSSAGIMALNNFDNNAALTLSQAQQSYMGTVGQSLGISSQSAPNLSSVVNQNATTLGSLGSQFLQAKGNIQGRQISATEATGLAPYGGAQYTAQGMLGQYGVAQAGQLGGTLGTLGSSYLAGLNPKSGQQVNPTLGTPTGDAAISNTANSFTMPQFGIAG